MTSQEKIELIEKAIDAITDVAIDIPKADMHYFIHSENSVVSKLRHLLREFE